MAADVVLGYGKYCWLLDAFMLTDCLDKYKQLEMKGENDH